MGDDNDRRLIPDPPDSVIAYVDGYGNIKTTIAYNPARVRPGNRIKVRILDQNHEAMVRDGAFAVPHGKMAFAPGSSGWRTKEGKDVQWIEVFFRGGNAWERFGRPPIGSPIVISA